MRRNLPFMSDDQSEMMTISKVEKRMCKEIARKLKTVTESENEFSAELVDALYGILLLYHAYKLENEEINGKETVPVKNEEYLKCFVENIVKDKKIKQNINIFVEFIEQMEENHEFSSESSEKELTGKRKRANPKIKYRYQTEQLEKKRKQGKKVKLEMNKTKSNKFL